jgi:hypothetical protein
MKNKTLNQLANSRNKFIVVAVDETEYWRDDIAAKAQKIECVYLIDLTKPTHCCELAVSYWATFISNYFHNRDAWDDDELTDMEHENGGEEGCYFSGSSTFKIVKRYYSGTLEEAEENERCNPTYC